MEYTSNIFSNCTHKTGTCTAACILYGTNLLDNFYDECGEWERNIKMTYKHDNLADPHKIYEKLIDNEIIRNPDTLIEVITKNYINFNLVEILSDIDINTNQPTILIITQHNHSILIFINNEIEKYYIRDPHITRQFNFDDPIVFMNHIKQYYNMGNEYNIMIFVSHKNDDVTEINLSDDIFNTEIKSIDIKKIADYWYDQMIEEKIPYNEIVNTVNKRLSDAVKINKFTEMDKEKILNLLKEIIIKNDKLEDQIFDNILCNSFLDDKFDKELAEGLLQVNLNELIMDNKISIIVKDKLLKSIKEKIEECYKSVNHPITPQKVETATKLDSYESFGGSYELFEKQNKIYEEFVYKFHKYQALELEMISDFVRKRADDLGKEATESLQLYDLVMKQIRIYCNISNIELYSTPQTFIKSTDELVDIIYQQFKMGTMKNEPIDGIDAWVRKRAKSIGKGDKQISDIYNSVIKKIRDYYNSETGIDLYSPDKYQNSTLVDQIYDECMKIYRSKLLDSNQNKDAVLKNIQIHATSIIQSLNLTAEVSNKIVEDILNKALSEIKIAESSKVPEKKSDSYNLLEISDQIYYDFIIKYSEYSVLDLEIISTFVKTRAYESADKIIEITDIYNSVMAKINEYCKKSNITTSKKGYWNLENELIFTDS